MASCNGDCSGFKATDGKWFKIDEGGYTNGQWASDKLIASALDCSRRSKSYTDFPGVAMQVATNGLPPFPLDSPLGNT